MKDTMRRSLAVAMELSVLIVAAYYCHPYLASAMDWDQNMAFLALFTLVMIGWIARVYFLFERSSKEH